jgi:hypothetical protein
LQAINDHNSNDDEAKRLTEIVLCQLEDPAVPELKAKLPKASILKLPELSYGKNPEVPSYSSAVNLEYNKKVGRHFIANRDINAGIFIFFLNIIFCITLSF